MTPESRKALKQALVECLEPAAEIKRIVIFGSFLTSPSPNDIDVAIFQDSADGYLPLALKYRRMARLVAERLPLDIIPLRSDAVGEFAAAINAGEVIYQR